MKVVINKCYGGFGLSPDAIKQLVLLEAKCIKSWTVNEYYGSDKKDFKKDYVDDIGDGFKAHRYGYNIYSEKDKLIYDYYGDDDTRRADPTLVAIVETMGKAANGRYSNLSIVEIPDGIRWEIDEYDGYEHIDESHRSWG